MSRWLLVLMVVLFCGAANAAGRPASIVLLVPPRMSAELAETLTRVHGELVADGLEVSKQPFEGRAEAADLLRVAATQAAALAVVGLFPRDEGEGLELWVVDRLTGKSLVTRVEVNGWQTETQPAAPVSPEVLSRRAVEVLRATLLEPWFTRRKTETSRKPQATPAVAPPRIKAALWRVGAGVGGGALWNAESLEPALLPSFSLRLAYADLVFTRVSAAGLGTRPRIERSEGSARVEQDLILLDVGSWLLASGVVRPSVSLGVGAWRFEADAKAVSPFVPTRDERWALAMKASAGVAVYWRKRWGVEAELEGLLSTPYAQVRFDGAEVARFGRPSLFGKLMLAGWL